jgi:paraquat-inducible protein A
MWTDSARPATEPGLHECPSCGLLQTIPALMPGMTARCVRCPAILRHTATHSFEHSIALTTAALVLLTIMCATPLMGVEKAAISRSANLFSGPAELARQGMSPLAAVVLFVTVVAPFGKLIGTLYVLVRLREPRPPRHLRRVFLMAERLRPWSMIEVFVFGVFVAYVKLSDLVHLQLDPGVFALMALTVVLIWADTALDREAVWARLAPENAGATGSHGDRMTGSAGGEPRGCDTCGLVSVLQPGDPHCPRCGVTLHVRRPNSIARTWALLIAAAILYLPANYYPVLTVVQLGAGSPSTILGGIHELVSAGMYPLAALVFSASIAVPMLKLVGLTTMLITTQTGRSGWLRDRTRLYHAVRLIGRWSMIDIFMEALLGALVKFGNVVTIEPGVGALAFCAVVILTMFAAEAFDPRLMWDAATLRQQQQPALG